MAYSDLYVATFSGTTTGIVTDSYSSQYGLPPSDISLGCSDDVLESSFLLKVTLLARKYFLLTKYDYQHNYGTICKEIGYWRFQM
jgi:hypothetical protein